MNLKLKNPDWETLQLRDFALENNELFDGIPRSRRVKREYIKQGYDQQMSLYGVVSEKEKGDFHYKRIEILSDKPFTDELLKLVYYFFKEFIPPESYTIWILDSANERIRPVGEFV